MPSDLPADLKDVWVYLSASPLLHLTLTLVAYQAGMWIYTRGKLNPLLNPVLFAVVVLVAILLATGTSYETFFEGAQFVHFLLGPATVSLAIPLYRQFHRVRESGMAIAVSLLSGAATAAISAMAIAWALGAARTTVISIGPKSVTAPVAMGISDNLGGLPSLTAVMVIATGILGAALGPLVLDAVRVKDWASRGFAMGTGAHGIGTARALQVNEIAGAFSGLAMGLNALATAILLPLLWALFF
ncbi:LrgB family protein [Oricola cellulosilytica]|uniref:LrgB family protein n=1 Tax=Oricola cellulosilytica TaxID=1429082 RepID=A0A4R0P8I2_9HYPH|nr:LrgB family protein [Oricola cellulosilytica]TCD10959.1 LrgB family protein [Oricola cellulosilytica]